jgi:rhodanese-related sulfurtransferase
LVVVLVGSLAAYILWKYVQRRRFLHRLRVARISPKELMEKPAAGEETFIVDLRHPLDVAPFPQAISDALRVAVEELEKRHRKIPRDRDIILYCS